MTNPIPSLKAIYDMARNTRLNNPKLLLWTALKAWAKAYDYGEAPSGWMRAFKDGWVSAETQNPLEFRIARLKAEIEQTRDTLNLMLGELGELEDRAAGIQESEPQPYTEWTNDGVKGTGRTYGKERLG